MGTHQLHSQMERERLLGVPSPAPPSGFPGVPGKKNQKYFLTRRDMPRDTLSVTF